MTKDMMNLTKKFTSKARDRMLEDLETIKDSIQATTSAFPKSEIISMDIRLCIDYDSGNPSWNLRTGASEYDPGDTEVCASGVIEIDSNCSAVLDDLIAQCLTLIEEIP